MQLVAGKRSPEARVWCVHLLERSLRQIKMYKRQFYGVDHADNNGDEASSSDSSSLDTDSDASSGDEEQDVAKSAYVSSSDAEAGVLIFFAPNYLSSLCSLWSFWSLVCWLSLLFCG